MKDWILNVSIKGEYVIHVFPTCTVKVLEENKVEEKTNDSGLKRKEKKPELEDLNFFLKSGIILCKLISKIDPTCQIDLEILEVII